MLPLGNGAVTRPHEGTIVTDQPEPEWGTDAAAALTVTEKRPSSSRPFDHRTALRHDHGSVHLSGVFQAEIAFLGMTSSPAFFRQPKGNGCIERFLRTLTELF